MPIDLNKYPLDPEVIAYLEKVAANYPDANGALSVEDNRRMYLEMCASFEAPIPEGLTITDYSMDGRNGEIPLRRYENLSKASDVTILYFHGGGFVVGNLDSHNSVCAEIASRTGYRLVAVDYKLAPEYVHPVSYQDAQDAFLAIDQGRTIVAGDSAGGTLSACICTGQHGTERQPIGQMLIYPWLGGDLFDLESYRSCADAPGLTTQDIQDYRKLRSRGEPEDHDSTYYPLVHKEFTDLPPCIAIAAEFDPIRDDAVLYVEKLTQAGVYAKSVIEPGLTHSYLRARHMSTKARDSFSRICDGIVELANL